LPSTDGIHANDAIHLLNLASHVRPLSAGQASPAARAAGVLVSSHLLRAVQTWVRVVSVATRRPRRSSPSSFPGGGVGYSGPVIPHSSSEFAESSLAQPPSELAAMTNTGRSAANLMLVASSTPRAAGPLRIFNMLQYSTGVMVRPAW